MTLLEAIYGSQYQEISQRGGDGSKGRFNGNLLISVIFLLLLLRIQQRKMQKAERHKFTGP